MHPVVWVNGPPGCGKTTLVASYLERRRAKGYWYRVDEGDRDPATFFAQLGLLGTGSRNGDGLPYFTADYQHALDLFTRRFFRALYAELGTRSILALDDCHLAAGDTFNLILRCACSELPRGVCLILISRESRPAALVSHVASETLMDIGWPELRLDAAETHELADRVSRSRWAEDLHERTGGWAAGIVLLAANKVMHASPLRLEAASHEALFDYFAGEVLARSTPEEHAFLLETALLPETTPAMAVVLTGNPRAGLILDDLHRRNFFIQRKERADAYQYHDLFRTFLLSCLENTRDERALSRLRQRAARVLLSSGMETDAIPMFIRAQDWKAVAQALHSASPSLLHQGRWRTLNEWFERLPSSIVAADSWLLFWHASALVAVDVGRAAGSASRAYRRFLQHGDSIGQIYAIHLRMDMIWISSRSIARSAEWMPILEAHLTRMRNLPPGELGIRAWNAYMQMAVYGRRKGILLNRSARWLTRCGAAVHLHPNQRMAACDMLLAYALYTTDLALGESLRTILSGLVDDDGVSAWGRMWALKWLGRWDLALGRFESALQHFERGLEFADVCHARAQSMDIGTHRVITFCLLGRHAEAAAALQKMQLDADDNNYIRATYHEAWAFYSAYVSDYQAALDYQRRTDRAWRKFGIPLTVGDSAMRLGLWHLAAGEIEHALEALRRARTLFSGTVAQYAEAVLDFALAEGTLQLGSEDDALRYLRAGLVAARNPVKAEMLRWIRPFLPSLLNLAIEIDIEPHTARELIRRLDVEAPSHAGTDWPWPVAIHCLGEMQLVVDGRSLDVKGRAQFKQHQLLRLLICQMGSSVSVDTVAEWLWPDADGDHAQNSLKVTLHRLRKLLGHDAIRLHDGKLSLNERVCWVDAWAFASALDRNSDTTDLHAKQQALALYRGQFLPQHSHPWILPVRKRLRQKFLNAVSTAGRSLEAAGAGDAAMDLYMRCLDIEPDAELPALRLL